jgi:signal transduction histidine kinase
MTGAISHEIRTPLNTAFMALDLLSSTISAPNSSVQDVSEKENMLDIVKTVKEGCDISLNILNELLTFEKLRAGMMQLEPKLVPLVQHIESNVGIFQVQVRGLLRNL